MPHPPPHDDDNARKSYETLITHLHPSPPQVLEIDILPSSSGPHIQYSPTDSALGIPKQLLISAFLTARHLFFTHLPSSRSRHASSSSSSAEESPPAAAATAAGNADDDDDEDDGPILYQATTLLLLLDPNHTTAINYRKRYILSHHHQSSAATATEEEDALVGAELLWLASLLTSPLPKHTKSPTLWAHRIWLLRRFVVLGPPLPTPTPTTTEGGDQLPPSSSSSSSSPNHGVVVVVVARETTGGLDGVRRQLEKELEVVMKAGERHPRNYYGWWYAREVVRLVDGVLEEEEEEGRGGEGWVGEEEEDGRKRMVEEEEEEEEEEWRKRMVERVKRWCFGHPRDISGWNFLVWLLERQQMKRLGCRGRGEDVVWGVILRETETFVEKYEWRGESVEWFLKALRRLQGNDG